MDLESKRATLIACLTEPLSADGGELSSLPAEVEWLEVRADLIGEVDPAWLREKSGGRHLIYTLRSKAEGGVCESSKRRRRERQSAASKAGFDLIDLEAARDLDDALLEAIPAQRRLISWHGRALALPKLRRRFEEVSSVPARLYKLVSAAESPGEELAPLALLMSLQRRDVVAFAAGATGTWTRLIAPRIGANVVYGAASALPAAPGQISVTALVRDYGLPLLSPVAQVYGIVGKPVAASLSPRLHNGAYRELGIDALYLPFHAETFGEFWLEVVEGTLFPELGLPIRGLSVTAPYKSVALAVAGAPSPLAEAIGAANTLVRTEGVWEAEATDPEGVLEPLLRRGVRLGGLPTVVVGAGGAGRSAAVGLARAGARVTLANRSVERGQAVAAKLELPFVALADLDPSRFSLLVSAIPGDAEGDPPLAVSRLPAGAVVADMAYGDAGTPLLRAARKAGLMTVSGREILLAQAFSQFRAMTGVTLPRALGRRLLGLEEEES